MLDFAEYEDGNLIFTASGFADVVKDKTVYELKFVSDLSHEHFLQCACYMVALNLDRGVLWNVRNNDMYSISISDRQAFMNAVAKTITKMKLQEYYEPILRKAVVDEVPKMEKREHQGNGECFAVIDTETNYGNQVISIGAVIADSRSFEAVDKKYYIIEPECKNPGMFNFALNRHTGQHCSRTDALDELREVLDQHGVSRLFAYHASFDKGHLGELSDFSWCDIESRAAYTQYNPAIPEDAECFKSGRLKRNYGVESMMRLMTHDQRYSEKHNALDDAVDELMLMRILGYYPNEYDVMDSYGNRQRSSSYHKEIDSKEEPQKEYHDKTYSETKLNFNSEYTVKPDATPRDERQSYSGRISFAKGDRIYHRVFGEGTVISIFILNESWFSEIEFDDCGRKRLIMSYAEKMISVIKQDVVSDNKPKQNIDTTVEEMLDAKRFDQQSDNVKKNKEKKSDQSSYRPRCEKVELNMVDYCTTNEAAMLLGCSKSKVYDLIAQGKLNAHKRGNKYLISRKSIAEYLDYMEEQRKAMQRIALLSTIAAFVMLPLILLFLWLLFGNK